MRAVVPAMRAGQDVAESADIAPEGERCNASNGTHGSYRCTRPKGHTGEHWQAVIVASWDHKFPDVPFSEATHE